MHENHQPADPKHLDQSCRLILSLWFPLKCVKKPEISCVFCPLSSLHPLLCNLSLPLAAAVKETPSLRSCASLCRLSF